MTKTKVLLACVLLLVANSALAHDFVRAKTLEDAWRAVCRIDVTGARGSGWFAGVDSQGRAVIVTNYHVVTTNKQCTAQFWTNGHRETVAGRVVSVYNDPSLPADFALITVDASALSAIDPPYIPLGGADAAPDVNSLILSAGAPRGRFVQAWEGTVLSYYRGATALFTPGPVPGQSGSPVVSVVDGELWATGILTWLIGAEGADDSKGGAIPIANLYRASHGRETSTPSASPIPPDAVECAERQPRVVVVCQDNCEPCVQARPEMAKVRQAGYTVEELNASVDKKAKAYNVAATPTWIVLDGNDREFVRYAGARKGDIVLTALRYLDARPKPEPVPTPKQTDFDPAQLPPPQTQTDDDLDTTVGSQTDAETETAPIQEAAPLFEDLAEPDFRTRPSVYDLKDSVDFLADSNNRWLDRAKKKAEPAPKKEEPAPKRKTEPTPIPDDGRLGDRLGSRLTDGIKRELTDALVDVERKIDDKVAFYAARVKTKVREYLIIGAFLFFVAAYFGSRAGAARAATAAASTAPKKRVVASGDSFRASAKSSTKTTSKRAK